MKKKKNKKFQDININIENNPKKTFSILTTIKNANPDYIITLPNISYIVLRQKNIQNNITTWSFSIYNIINFELIQNIITSSNNCLILDEDFIILSGMKNSSEIWKREKEKGSKFSKYKSLNFSINSNILYDSKSYLFFHNYYDYMKSSLEIWDTENKIPKSIITKTDISTSYEKQIFLINDNKILVVYHCPIEWGKHFENISISFYDITCKENIKNVKNIELENRYCDFKPFKLDENRILIIEKVSEDNSYDQNVNQTIHIMKVPEFEIVKEMEVEFIVSDIIVYKKYFILYEGFIKIYNSDNYQIFKEINIQGIYKLVHLKDNFFIGIVNRYYNTVSNFTYDYYEGNIQKRDLIKYEVDL